MKTWKKIVFAGGIFLAVLLLAGGLFLGHIARRAIPDYNRSHRLPGLMAGVDVYRDPMAIPHVIASNEHDLYMAVGFVMAQDRLWQMDLLRRVTMGRLSEIFGDDMADADALLRSLRMGEKSARVLEQIDADLKAALDAFCKGVNLFIEQHPKTLPPEFAILGYRPEPWEPIHSVNLIGYMAWDLAGSWQSEIIMHKLRAHLSEELFEALMPDMGLHQSFVYPSLDRVYEKESQASLFPVLEASKKLKDLGLEVFSASNNWAVSGHRSETGAPLLANDMHLSFGAPGIWYQMYQEVEGGLKVRGVVLPGQPFVIVGHNERIAWGMTNVYVDDMDFYLETIEPEQGNTYLFNGEWRDLEIRKEIIHAKGGGEHERTLKFTHRGPIISSFKNVKDQAISMRWTGNDMSNELRSIYLLNRAGGWDDFRDALRTMTSVSQNIVYADVDGNIGLQTAVGIPLRANGNGWFVYPGETDRYDWTGMVPFEEVPFVFNPASGEVSSANNRTVPDDYPHYIGYQYALPYRIDRIRELLSSRERHNAEHFRLMMGDYHSKLVERFLPGLLKVLSEESMRGNSEKALDLLRTWSGEVLKDSPGPAIFEMFYVSFLAYMALDVMGEDLYREFLGDGASAHQLFVHAWQNHDSPWLRKPGETPGEEFRRAVVSSFEDAVSRLEKLLGNNPEKWTWGRIHQLLVNHPMGGVKILDRLFGLNVGPFPASGSFHTVNPFSYSLRNPFGAVHGASQRHIFDLSDWSQSYLLIPTGTSGIPASKYYGNQIMQFLDNTPYRLPWTREEIMESARYHSLLAPVR